MIDTTYDFNAPFKVTECIRFGRQVPTEESEVVDGDVVPKMKMEYEEYSRDAYICWEDIKEILGYPYKDDWKVKGEKFFVLLRDCPNEMIVLGNKDSFVNYWTTFRKKYPLFLDR
jgi:hypothetical protein